LTQKPPPANFPQQFLFVGNLPVFHTEHAGGARADKIALIGAGEQRLGPADAGNQPAPAIGVQFAEYVIQQPKRRLALARLQ